MHKYHTPLTPVINAVRDWLRERFQKRPPRVEMGSTVDLTHKGRVVARVMLTEISTDSRTGTVARLESIDRLRWRNI